MPSPLPRKIPRVPVSISAMSGIPSPFRSATAAGPGALSTSWSACFSVGLKGAVAVAQLDADPGRAIKLGLPGQDQIDVPIAVQVRRREGKLPLHAALRLGALPEGAVAVAEQHLHVARDHRNRVWNPVAIGVRYSHPVARVRVVAPRKKRWAAQR